MEMTSEKIRIGYYLRNIMLGGVGRYIRLLAEGLDRTVFEPVVFLTALPGPETSAYLAGLKNQEIAFRFLDEDGVPLEEGIVFYQHPEAGQTPLPAPQGSSAGQRLLDRFTGRKQLETAWVEQVAARAEAAFRAETLDILHFNLGYFPQPHMNGLLTGALRADVSLGVLTVHSAAPERPQRESAAARRFRLEAARGFDAVITVNQESRRSLIKNFCFSPEKVTFIPNGVSLRPVGISSVDETRRHLGITESCLMVVVPARLSEEKGHDLFLQAAARILHAGHEVRYVFAGDGPCEAALREQVRALGLESSVVFLGFTDRLTDILLAADLVVLPSRREGFPFVLLEAMAAGKPVLATDVGGVRQLVGAEGAGLVVAPGNIQTLADGLRHFFKLPPESRNRMGRIGFAAVRDNFSVEQMREATYELYFPAVVGAFENGESLFPMELVPEDEVGV